MITQEDPRFGIYKDSLKIATIVDADPQKGHYRIKIAGLPGIFPAKDGSTPGSFLPGSGLSLGSLGAGTQVIVFLSHEWPTFPAYVVTAVSSGPNFNENLVFHVPDWNDWPPPVPWNFEEYFGARQPYYVDYGGSDYFGLPEQYGVIYPSGARMSVDLMMAQLKAGKKAGVEAHVLDQTLKLVGWNLLEFTGGAQEKKMVEQGEYNEVYMSSPTMWEVREGPFNKASIKVDSAVNVIPRHMVFKGYRGDLEREIIQTPVIIAYDQYPRYEYGYDENGDPIPNDEGYQSAPDDNLGNNSMMGLMDIQKRIDGAYVVRSAKSITLQKCSFLPAVFPQLEESEYFYDPTGISTPNYWPAGITPLSWDAYLEFNVYPSGSIVQTTRNSATSVYAALDGGDTELFDYTKYGVAGIAGVLSGYEFAARKTEFEKTLQEYPAVGLSHPSDLVIWEPQYDWIGNDAEIDYSDSVAWLNVDHRTYSSYWPGRTAAIYLNENGSIVLEATDQTRSSRLIIDAEGVRIEAPTIRVIASEDFALGADAIYLTSGTNVQIAATQTMELWAAAPIILEDLGIGKLFAARTKQPTKYTLQLLSAGPGPRAEWQVIYETQVDNEVGYPGYKSLTFPLVYQGTTIQAADLANNLLKIRLITNVERDPSSYDYTSDYDNPHTDEYIESLPFGATGGGSSRMLSVNGGNARTTFNIAAGDVITAVTLKNDPNGVPVIDFTTACFTVEVPAPS